MQTSTASAAITAGGLRLRAMRADDRDRLLRFHRSLSRETVYLRFFSVHAAEVAFVVADSWQGEGLGKKLFASLVTRARDVGIHRFVADTLPWYDAGVVQVEIDLRCPNDDVLRR
jgi:GNAT superfamily N-acetyltransferase